MQITGAGAAQVGAQQTLKSHGEAGEVGPDHDGDADDAKLQAAAGTASHTTPAVNTLGQTTGTIVNTKA